MKFGPSIILLLCVLISACSHLPSQQPKEQSALPETNAPEPNVAEASPNAGEASPSDKQTSPTVVDASQQQASELEQTSQTEGESVKPSTASVEQVPVTDLMSRLRNGFELPEFDSKYTRDYERWNSKHPTYLNNLFARAEPFLFYIIEELEKRDMPLEIALLPAVESGYKPEAYSSSRAAGLWQFIPSTGRHFGLKEDWWFDGRRDPLMATQAALDYLQELNAMFDGDWFLTLAAYNAGQGTLRRAIARNKSKGRNTDYGSLKLRQETTRYVPKLIALRNIIRDPQQFQVKLPDLSNQTYFTVVPLAGQTDLQVFAKESGININTLRHLNAGHRRWATAPQGPHRLLVPLSHELQATSTSERLAKQPTIKYQNHRIKRGETLSVIARRYDVSVSAIQQANKLRDSRIRAGRDLIIPVAANPYQQTTVVSSSQAGKPIVHRVVQGDTLWSIARRYQVQVNQLMDWNQLSSSQVLNLNQALTIFLN